MRTRILTYQSADVDAVIFDFEGNNLDGNDGDKILQMMLPLWYLQCNVTSVILIPENGRYSTSGRLEN